MHGERSTIGTVFRNSSIETFPELELFTSVLNFESSPFNGSTIKSLKLPPNITTFKNAFTNVSTLNMDVLEIPTSVKDFYRPEPSGGYIGMFVIKSALNSFIPFRLNSYSIKGYRGTFVLDVNSVIPVSNQYVGESYYFVPDDLVDDYKAHSSWSSYASRIYPISELPD